VRLLVVFHSFYRYYVILVVYGKSLVGFYLLYRDPFSGVYNRSVHTRFTVLEVTADSHELTTPQRTMRSSIARPSKQRSTHAWCSMQLYHLPTSCTALPVMQLPLPRL